MILILYFINGDIERHEDVRALQGDPVQLNFVDNTGQSIYVSLPVLIKFEVE